MRQYGMTIEDAAREWVNEFDAVCTDMLQEMVRLGFDGWSEVTMPCKCDRVYVYNPPEESDEHCGTIVNIREPSDDDDFETVLYEIELDSGATVFCEDDDFEVDRDSTFPMWSAMWQYHDPCDMYWLEECDGIRIMSEIGFRVYDFDEYGCFFGIDGCGFDFYEAFWIPLYKARGLQWHDPMTESGSFVMDELRKAYLYNKMLGYLSELISESSELVSVLRKLGFTDQEIVFEGLEVIGDETET